ncbi:uncharacterized protein WM277_016900 [Molossus nigricans]
MSESSFGGNTSRQETRPWSSSPCSDPREPLAWSALSRNRTFRSRSDSGISSQDLNISFQDLGDPYQVANFNRILRRLIRVETLWLVDNSLVDLSAIRLPSCRVLNMNKNHLTSFKQLPKVPQIRRLCLAENHIETLAGLSSLRGTPLESLVLKRNPCEFYPNYRKRTTVISSLSGNLSYKGLDHL